MKKPDLTRRYLGSPCHRGHSGWRYRRGGGCVECAQITISDRAARDKDKRADSRPARMDAFREAIERAVHHMYAAGQELWTAKDQQVRGWRQELAKYGLTQRTAAELRRYALRVDTERAQVKRFEDAVCGQSADWLKD